MPACPRRGPMVDVDATVAVDNPIGYFSAVRTVTFDVPRYASGRVEVFVGFDQKAQGAGQANTMCGLSVSSSGLSRGPNFPLQLTVGTRWEPTTTSRLPSKLGWPVLGTSPRMDSCASLARKAKRPRMPGV